MRYRVFAEGKRCMEYDVNNLYIDTFDTFEEAVVYLIQWFYLINKESAISYSKRFSVMLDTPIDMYIMGCKIEMCIKLVED